MAKGNFVAYQPLKPTENKVGDIIASNIDYLIKTGQAERARKIKELQDRNASIAEFGKSIKIEAKETDKYLTDMNVKLTTDTTTFIGNAMQNAYNSTNDADKQKWMRYAQNASESYKTIQNTFGGTKFLDGVKNAREFAQSGEAFDQSEQIKLVQAVENSMIRQQLNDDGTISFFGKVGDKINDPEKEFTTGEISLMFQQQLPINMLEDTKTRGDGLYTQMRKTAPLLIQEYTKNPTGDRKISVKEFVRQKGEIEFNTLFGKDLNVNRSKDDAFGQFAIRTIGKLPTTEEEQAQVKEAFIEKLWSYAPSETLDVQEKSAIEKAQAQATLQGTILSNKQKAYDLENPTPRGGGGGGNGGGGSQGFTAISDGMVSNKGNVIVQIRDNKGNVRGVQRWSSATTGLPKVKNYPATENTFGLSYFKNKKGDEVPTIIMGASAEDGKIVYNKISPSEFSTYVSKAGYDPLKVLNTLSSNRPQYNNKYSSQVDARNPIYQKVKIGYKSKDIKEDSGDGFIP